MISRRELGFGFGAMSLAACVSTPREVSPADDWMAVDQVTTDINLLEQAYQRVHPGYTRYTSADEMSGIWRTLKDDVVRSNGIALDDLYMKIQRGLTHIRCDHTKAELPAVMKVQRQTGAFYLPFRWELIDGRAFVTRAPLGSALTLGDEVLSVDGRSVRKMVAEVSPYIPVDGYTEWAKRGSVSASLEFMGGAVDHFGAILWDVSEMALVMVRHADGRQKTYTLSRISHEAWSNISGDQGAAANFKDAVAFETIGDNGGYLRVDTFVNYRDPVDPVTVYGPVFDQMKAQGRAHLIVDLRQNGGGSTDASHGLVAHIIDRPLRIKTDMRVKTLNYEGLREHIRTWDQSALNPNPDDFTQNGDGSYSLKRERSDEMNEIQPTANAFRGQLYILTSDQNSSGSTNISSVLQSEGRATLIGEQTGGSPEGTTAGVLFTLELPESKIRTRIPVFRYTNNVKSFERGMGLKPDILVPRTVESFLAGTDPALERAIAQFA